MAPPPLVQSKLLVPPTRSDLVNRPRLVTQLDQGLSVPLTLVIAPAGFGKTTLISAWLARAGPHSPPVAWVSLDSGDNDPVRFWTYVVTALDSLRPGLSAPVLGVLQSTQPPQVQAVLSTLLNGLAALPTDVGLVLDDYHLIHSRAVHDALTYFLEHLPPHLHLVISSRADPPLPLSRLRARASLAEVRLDDLRFTPGEVAAFLAETMGLSLPEEEVAALEARTEGWIAGLQFAALSLKGRSVEQATSFVAAFAGSNRYVTDYLTEEVLGQQPIPIQSFLLQTSVLDRLCAPLCDALLGPPVVEDGEPEPGRAGTGGEARRSRGLVSMPGAQATLEYLERANLFLIPLDDERRWYRYHSLFSDVLRTRVKQAQPGLVGELHRRASEWFEAEGLASEAVQHALAAADTERAARLVEEVGAATIVRGRVQTVLGWLEALPDDLVRGRPRLLVTYAQALMFASRPSEAEARLRDAERWVESGASSEEARTVRGLIALTRGGLARFSGDLATCSELGRQSLDLLPEGEAFWRGIATLNAAYACLVTGDVGPESERRVAAAVPAARTTGHLFSVLRSIVLLGCLQVLQGRLHQAAATYQEALEVAPGPGGLATLVGSPGYYFGLGALFLEWNRLDDSAAFLDQGLSLTRGTLTVDAHTVLLGYTALARLRRARGDDRGAIEAMDSFFALARERGFVESVARRGEAVRARLALGRGDLTRAIRWAALSGLTLDEEPSYPREEEHLALARVRIAECRVRLAEPRPDYGGDQLLEDTLRFLDRLLASAESCGRMGSALEILILRALASELKGEREAAVADLERALSLAEPEGYVRTFVDEGEPLRKLLEAAQGSASSITPGAAAYLRWLLGAFADSSRARHETEAPESSNRPSVTRRGLTLVPRSPHPSFSHSPSETAELVEPLTEREVEVLGLIAAGASNREIADRLVVSLGTIKKHGNNIFAKLGVASRTQAVARASALGLLRADGGLVSAR